ncbi:MAG: hypothetical protein RLZZ127_1532 [Planctomycetota bacterium]|jgi:lipoate-protein ligase A
MSGWSEPRPDLVQPNPGGPDDPLGESVLDAAQPPVRVFAPQDARIVIGRGQDPERELRLDAIRADVVPVHRRATGGGAVVLAPGMVVVALRLPGDTTDPDIHFARVNAALIPAITTVAGEAPQCRGHGDLTLADPHGGERRKILGASLRHNAAGAYYLGVLLVDDAVPLMERWLAAPSRRPAYRGERGHRAFCDHLGRLGVTVEALVPALRTACTGRDWRAATTACTA